MLFKNFKYLLYFTILELNNQLQMLGAFPFHPIVDPGLKSAGMTGVLERFSFLFFDYKIYTILKKSNK
jgi:hypothetical protein